MQTTKAIIPLIDLATYKKEESAEHIAKLCRSAVTPFGRVASVGVAPELVPLARKTLDELHGELVKVATVVNYPDGNDEFDEVLKATAQVLNEGANEIELVFPHVQFKAGNEAQAVKLVSAVSALCIPHGATLKVILETTALADEALILRASEIAVENGAHFLRTSSIARNKNGDTPETLSAMLDVINRYGGNVGIKISASTANLEMARRYLQLIEARNGENWVKPNHVRLSSLTLLTEILNDLGAISTDDQI